MISINYISGSWCLMGSLILAVMYMGLRVGKKMRGSAPVVECFEWMLLSGVFMMGLNGTAIIGRTAFAPVIFRLLKMCSYHTAFFLLLLYSRYLFLVIRIRIRKDLNYKKNTEYMVYFCCIMGGLLWGITSFYPLFYDVITDSFIFSPWLVTVSMIVFIIIAADVTILFRHSAEIGFWSAFLLEMMLVVPAAESVIEVVFHTPPFFFQTVIADLVIAHVMMQHYQEQRMIRETSAREKDRLLIVSGRMQPHFLYNCLTTIYMLCEDDPERAQEAIEIFTGYLRDTLDTLDSRDVVSFEWELKQTERYMYLEKLRFGDKIEIHYDIRSADFCLPPLSVQSMVDNAVKHGPGNGRQPVRITLQTFETDKENVVIIEDDGKGFDKGSVSGDMRRHLGIETVTERVRLISQGQVRVDSLPGYGTRAELHFPKRKD